MEFKNAQEIDMSANFDVVCVGPPKRYRLTHGKRYTVNQIGFNGDFRVRCNTGRNVWYNKKYFKKAEKKISPAEAWWSVFGAMLERKIDGTIEDFIIEDCHKKLIGKDKDGTEVYDMHLTCKIIPKTSLQYLDLKFKVLSTGVEFDYDSKKYESQEQVLLRFGVKNKNGRTYFPSNVKPLIGELNHKGSNCELLGEIGTPASDVVDLSKASHNTSNIRIEDDLLIGEVRPLKFPNENSDNLIKMMERGDVVFRPRGTGVVNKDGTIENLKILSFDAIPKSEDSFEGLI